MIRARDLRLPGVHFLPAPPAAAAGLPPLDVAAFVGFAERGPLHTPVALEDADAYRDVFGGDVALARTTGGDAVQANLPAAVAAFFANGGRRCHVVRVAGAAARARLLVPGVVALSGGRARRATVDAAWEGRWAGQLSVATRLDRVALPPAFFRVASGLELLWQTGTAPQAVRAGDLLRLRLDDGDWLFPVSAVEPLPDGARTVRLVAERAWRYTTVDAASPPLAVAAIARLHAEGETPIGAGGSLTRRGAAIELELSPDAAPLVGAGDVLVLTLDDGSRHLFPVGAVRAASAGGSPPQRGAIGAGEALLALAPEPLPLASPPALPAVERLRFDLALWEARVARPALSELAFNRGHARFWGHAVLLESSARYRRPGAAGEDAHAAAAAVYRRLRAGRRVDGDPRHARDLAVLTEHLREGTADLPLALVAGRLAPLDDDEAAATYLPLGMPGVFDPQARAGAVTLGADGLDAFEAALFLDPALVPLPEAQPPAGEALLAEAFHRHYVENRRLRGLHALTHVAEVALLAVPDASHPAWSPAVTAPPAPQAPGAPPAPPPLDLSVFDDCDRPEPAPPAPEPAPPAPTGRALPDVLAFDEAPLLAVHEAMIGLCLARADVVAILSLPRHFARRECIGWQEALRARLGLPPRRTPGGDVTGLPDLSYAAVYHPWLLARDPAAPGGVRAVPPDGAACGTIAARERARGAWIAPANVPLAGALGATPTLPADDAADLFERQLNLARLEPRDVRVMSAHTLADDPSLLQLSVRRLMILLRKVAADLGLDLVFEPNDERLRRRVEVTLTAMLGDMLARGALAGATPEDAFRVVTGGAVTTRFDRDAGRFLALIQVAPSQPLEFLTVLLTRVGDGLVRAAEV